MYDNDLIGNGTCLTIIVVFSAQDSTHGFVTRFQNVFPLIIEIFIDVKHYIENNVGFILQKKTLKSGLYFNGNDLIAKGTYLAVFLSTRFSSQLCNLSPELYFFSFNFLESLKSPLMWNITWTIVFN